MAIVRTQYITIAELNEILGVSTYTSDDLIKVYEASELLEYFMNTPLEDYDTSNAPTNLKLATAYQVLYNEGNDDNAYGNDSFTIGKYSASGNNTEKSDYTKISPKSRKYLFGLTRRVV